MKRKTTWQIPTPTLLALAVLALFLAPATGAEEGAGAMKKGKVELESIGALEFGPGGVLFIGDSQGAAVWAVDVEPPAAAGSGPITQVRDLDLKLAAMLGVGPREIRIQDMTVHRPSGTVYLSLMRGSGEKEQPVLVSVTRSGEIAEVDLGNAPHQRLAIGDAPAVGAKLYIWDSRGLTITDLEYLDGELYIAGLSNEEFASRLRRASYPFDGEIAETGLEIYHGAHGEWETMAPVFSFIPYDFGDKTHLLAGYLCTPLVTFPLSEVRSRDKLRGKTLAELGMGNIPTDMVAYDAGGEGWVLIVNSRRGTMKVKRADLEAAFARPGITEPVGPRTGVEDHTVPIGHVAQAADYDDEHIAILGREMEDGALYLGAAPKERL